MSLRVALFATLVLVPAATLGAQAPKPRARALGVAPGTLTTGPLNALTDVPGVRVGQVTVRQGDSVRTGITAILPHGGNLFQERVPAVIHVGNGFGKLLGVTQVRELGELETPILLTCTLCVWKVADALVTELLAQPGMEEVRSINPVVGETNDGYVLNVIRRRLVTQDDVHRALTTATSGPIEEGNVGAGAGTIAFGWKGGIGTSSRLVKAGDSTWTVGVLVQTNFGGDLTILGVPVGRALGRRGVSKEGAAQGKKGSIMIVVATNAPLSTRNLERLASRAIIGLGRTGSVGDNGSGDYVIAFSTNQAVRRTRNAKLVPGLDLGNDEMSNLFEGVADAAEEAIYNSLFVATTERANGYVVEALPVEEVMKVLRERGAIGR